MILIDLVLLTAGFLQQALPAAPLTCHFDKTAELEQSLSVSVSPAQGLALEDGLHAVEMVLNDAITLPASAGAITTTPGRDVLIRGRTEDAVFFTIGVDEAGYAALNMLWATPDTDTPSQRTWTGHCQNHERHIQRWLGS